jgi:hypothetical protein
MKLLNLNQRKVLSQIFVDMGKIIFTATVVSHFLPSFAGKINWIILGSGFVITLSFLIL